MPRAYAPLALVALALCACQGGVDPMVIEETRDLPPHERHLGLTSDQRFGDRAAFTGSAAAADRYRYDLPAGWAERPPTGIRAVNLRAPGGVACYLSETRAGGPAALANNVNRWRGQMGAEPLDAAAIAGLPRRELLGASAVRVRVAGDFAGGMGADPIPDALLVGLIQIDGDRVRTIKLLGPADAAAAAAEQLPAFVASLRRAEAAP